MLRPLRLVLTVVPLVLAVLVLSSCDSEDETLADLMGITLFNDDTEDTNLVGPDESPSDATVVASGDSRLIEVPVEDGQILEFRTETKGIELGFTQCEVNQDNLFPAIVRWDGTEMKCFSGLTN
ncbi:MAG: hypothetical protein AAF624_13150 [Bacteroidota bacterium]